VEGWTSIKVTVDVRDWINELRKIIAENVQKSSLNQDEVIRWMCNQTLIDAAHIAKETKDRKERTYAEATRPLDVKGLRETVDGWVKSGIPAKAPIQESVVN
jgi:predicted RNA-binding Zn ribbon-like protein